MMGGEGKGSLSLPNPLIFQPNQKRGITMRAAYILVLFFTVFCFPASAFSAPTTNQEVRMISTIGPVSSGILGVLSDAFTQETGIKVNFEGKGTGAALDTAKNGNVDIVLVHARKLEDQFIAEGYGFDRRELMYNDYVILGPKNDPAQIRGSKDAAEALRKIAAGKYPFVTRGDRSGTHMSELELWAASGMDMSKDTPSWYEVCPDGDKGNGPTAKYADKKGAYVLVERASWLSVQKDVSLDRLVSGDIRMMNFMALIRVNPQKIQGLNVEGALKLADWLVADRAQEIIEKFGVEEFGEPMFFPNSDQWRAKHPK